MSLSALAAAKLGLTGEQFAASLATYGYVGFWIATSAGVILYNKWILTTWGFHFPITLTMWHMFFCSLVSFALVRSGRVEGVEMTRPLYVSSVVPIGASRRRPAAPGATHSRLAGALFACTLWFGNAAYTYLSVSFIQMLKALMPAAVYTCSVAWVRPEAAPLATDAAQGIEKRDFETICVMVVISLGVAIASYGELAFVLTGVLLQLASVCSESNRIVLIQILLQSKGVKLNPITSMYYILPCCFAFLLIPWFLLEFPALVMDGEGAPFATPSGAFVLLTNAAAAFALNCSVFLLIGKSSALTMNIAGVVKDWLLIYLSWAIFTSPISGLNLFGYGIAFTAVCYYNYMKLKKMAVKGGEPASPKAASPSEAGPTKEGADGGS